ncbi:hypothetical protein PFDSM3638_09600 [Pyrococcus furiosus DSM 3638]|uniref:Uncharacterized protein n=3 Tax=Pyrococcus furiosus TaxID=2261 RepID=Q8TZS5_PYRFU|nr:hypothetical protein [Pyrococcus furiosus]AAL82032.1 hypothetical protein PF1908 [Pyrococcus furiosus DSM 3638]AFN04732.1 hypothetical protein PFC_09045 [Pyrococcus furiosus COM1]QEK79503.1 hypothetical protein PFDSM3638_09600 [Pyrococcus furiosus DSM 3638]
MRAKKISIFIFLFLIGASYIYSHVPNESVFLVPDAYIYGELNDTVLIRVYWIGTDFKEYNIIKNSNLSIIGLDGFATLKKAKIKETLKYHDPMIRELTFGIYLTLNKTGIYKKNVTLIIENKKESYHKELSAKWIFEISPKQNHSLKITDMIELEVGFFGRNVSPECMFAVKNIGTQPLTVLGVQYNISDLQIEEVTYINATNLDEIENNTKEIRLPLKGLTLNPNESKVIIVHFKKDDFRYPRKPAAIRFKIVYKEKDKIYAIPLVYTYEIVPIPAPEQLKE